MPSPHVQFVPRHLVLTCGVATCGPAELLIDELELLVELEELELLAGCVVSGGPENMPYVALCSGTIYHVNPCSFNQYVKELLRARCP